MCLRETFPKAFVVSNERANILQDGLLEAPDKNIPERKASPETVGSVWSSLS